MRIIFIQQPDEEIRPIEEFPGYWASNIGRIISAPKFNVSQQNKWIVLQGGLDGDGYRGVNLYREGEKHKKKVYILVGRAFNEYDDDLTKEWCHRPDANPLNCRADNLVWDTRKSNQWERHLASNPDFAQDIFIRENNRQRKPFYIQIPLEGKQKSIGGYHTTIEDARVVRDRLCIEYNIPLPIAA